MTPADEARHRRFLALALREARRAGAAGEVPVGCVIVKGDEVVAKGRNTREGRQTALGHAEIEAVKGACRKLDSWRLEGCDVYVTLEPCPMCAGALMQARVRAVYYGATDPKGGAVSLGFGIHASKKLNHRYAMEHVPMEECGQELREFFRMRRRS